VRIAVLGPGGVGGLVAGALARAYVLTRADAHPHTHAYARADAHTHACTRAPAGTRTHTQVTVIARDSTAETISTHGLAVKSVLLGDFTVHPRTATRLDEPVDALIVATKAAGLSDALERIAAPPKLVLPLLNGLDHLAVLRERFGERPVVAATIRVEADRPEPGVIVHTSQFLRVDMASRDHSMRAPMERLASVLSEAGIPARVYHPSNSTPPPAEGVGGSVQPSGAQAGLADGGEAQVMWSKLVRLNALACTTSAFDKLLGEIRSTPELRAELVGAIEEGCAVAQAEGAAIRSDDPLGELTAAHATLGSSMQRDIAAGRTPELDAIPGSVLRAAARHGIACPTIERLVAMIRARVAS
jgi:2-dehydropantoate 2-reductase